MFFSHKIRSINKNDFVLEIGPGSTPHYRANEFLELEYDTDETKISQRGGINREPIYGNRKVHYYNGGKFPFQDNQFDYVICSHVIEHVKDPELFIHELMRVSKGRGYIEYPLITYEYLYNFNVHIQFVKFNFETNKLAYLSKADTKLNDFLEISGLFSKSLDKGWGDLCMSQKELFFEGFEFSKPFSTYKAQSTSDLIPPINVIKNKSLLRRLISFTLNKLNL